MKMNPLATAVTLLLAATGVHSAVSIAQNSTGQNFFDDWTFITTADTNSGNVLYVDRTDAFAKGLTRFSPSGNAIIGVENITNGTGDPTFGRLSVQLQSNNSVGPGSLFIMDAAHLPFGCSVWPAVFMKAPNWPIGGEIDIVENVNLQKVNRYSLHTTQGCTHPNTSSVNSLETGNLISTDCFNQTNGNEGCVVADQSTNSYGEGFNDNGGGVFAMLWDATGIKTWFFGRSNIPSDVATGSPNPANWSTPSAFYPQSGCSTNKFFTPQFITVQIDICGSFAGNDQVFGQDCPGMCQTYVGNQTNYNDAYFEISYLRVFNGFSTPSQSSAVSTLSRVSSMNVIAVMTLCVGVLFLV